MQPVFEIEQPTSRTWFGSLYRYGKEVDSYDLIKVIAMLAMFVDHIGAYIFTEQLSMRVIGRLAAPIFFFLIGYSRSYRFKEDIFWCGILLTLCYLLTAKIFFLNILLSFTIIKYLFQYFHFEKYANKKLFFLFLFLSLMMPLSGSVLEYGTEGLMFAICGQLVSANKPNYFLFLIFAIASYFLEENLGFGFYEHRFYLSSFVFICFLLFLLMFFYRSRIWHLPKLLKIPALIISRYSLWIYTVHLIILRAI